MPLRIVANSKYYEVDADRMPFTSSILVLIVLCSIFTSAKSVSALVRIRLQNYLILLLNSKGQYESVIDSVECTYNEKLLMNVTCTTNVMGNGVRTLSIDTYAIKTLDHIFVSLIICFSFPCGNYSLIFCLYASPVVLKTKGSMFLKKKPKDKFRVFMGVNNLTVDICKYANGQVASLLLDMFVNALTHNGNILHPCPFSVKLHYYYAENKIWFLKNLHSNSRVTCI